MTHDKEFAEEATPASRNPLDHSPLPCPESENSHDRAMLVNAWLINRTGLEPFKFEGASTIPPRPADRIERRRRGLAVLTAGAILSATGIAATKTSAPGPKLRHRCGEW